MWSWCASCRQRAGDQGLAGTGQGGGYWRERACWPHPGPEAGHRPDRRGWGRAPPARFPPDRPAPRSWQRHRHRCWRHPGARHAAKAGGWRGGALRSGDGSGTYTAVISPRRNTAWAGTVSAGPGPPQSAPAPAGRARARAGVGSQIEPPFHGLRHRIGSRQGGAGHRGHPAAIGQAHASMAVALATRGWRDAGTCTTARMGWGRTRSARACRAWPDRRLGLGGEHPTVVGAVNGM